MSVVDRILSLMERDGVSGTALTNALEISSSSVSEWKKGKIKPSADVIVKIANYFNVSTDYLLLGKESSGRSYTEITANLSKGLDSMGAHLDISLDKDMLVRLEGTWHLLRVFYEFPKAVTTSDSERQLFARYCNMLTQLDITQDDIARWYTGNYAPAPSPFALSKLANFYESENLDWFDRGIFTEIKRAIVFYGAFIELAKKEKAVSK